MFRCSNVQMFKCSDVQLFRCSDVQMFKCSDVQMFRCSDVQLFRCSIVQMFRCSDIQMFRYSDVQMFRCSDVQMFNCSFVHLFFIKKDFQSLGLSIFPFLRPILQTLHVEPIFFHFQIASFSNFQIAYLFSTLVTRNSSHFSHFFFKIAIPKLHFPFLCYICTSK
jgi:hypothetical protein